MNTLMKKYRENQAHKDEVFDERKDEMLEAQKENKINTDGIDNEIQDDEKPF